MNDTVTGPEWQERAFKQAVAAMAIVGLDGRFLHVNGAFCKFLGYDPAEILSRDIGAITHPDDVDRSFEGAHELAAGEIDQLVMVKRYLRKDGDAVWGRLQASLIRDASGAPLHFLSQIEDVTESLRDRLTLEQRGAVLEAVAYAARRFLAADEWENEIEGVLEKLGQAAGASRVSLRQFVPEGADLLVKHRGGWSASDAPRAEFPGGMLSMHELGLDEVAQAYRRGEEIQRRKSQVVGRERETFERVGLLSTVGVPILVDGELWGAIGLHDCESEREWSPPVVDALRVAAHLVGAAIQRERSLSAVRESEERYRKLVEQAPEAIVVHARGTVLFANPAATRLLGLAEGDSIVGLGVLDLIHPTTTELSEELGGTDGSDVQRTFAERLVLPDGSERYVDIATADVTYAGRPARQAIIRNVTERREAEERLRESRERLRDFARRVVSVREEEGRRISRRIHDELGQNLTALKMDMGSGVRSESDSARSARMNALIDDTIGRVREIAAELRPPILDDLGLTGAIEWAMGEFRRRSGIDCDVKLCDEDVLDGAQSIALYRIVQEALANVVRHAEARHVWVSLEREDGAYVLEIRDDGKGIREGALEKGRSLGIVGMRERAESWGGVLTIESQPAAGTLVRVRLPIGELASGSAW